LENLTSANNWAGTWSVSPVDFSTSPLYFENQTLRARIRLTIGGTKLRLRFSNRFGHQPILLSAVGVASVNGDYTISERTNRLVTFNGNTSIIIQPKQEAVISGEIALETTGMDEICVSLFFLEKTTITTAYLGSSVCFTSVAGDYSGSAHFPIDENRIAGGHEPALPLLSSIDVFNDKEYRSVVTFGDSITAMDWPDYFAERLNKEPIKVGVLRQGIGGNKVLNDSPPSYRYGVAGIKRFKQDALQQAGVKYVIVLQGVNDIIHSCVPNPISESVDAEKIIAGLKKYIQYAHECNVRIFGTTIMPFGGYEGVASLEESKRQVVNDWIRTSGEFDGVIDFDAVTRNPENPLELVPEYDSGDHLHPSRKGAKAMADSIDLSQFFL